MKKQHAPRFLEIVADAKSRIRETDVATVRDRMERGDQFHLVDVREESEWQRGRLPGAVHLGKGVIERDIEEAIPDTSSEIVLYCGGGYRSALVADTLQRMGYRNVLSMAGGFSAWVDAGGEVVQ
jgi:rhodanese-related sulfurtransferase